MRDTLTAVDVFLFLAVIVLAIGIAIVGLRRRGRNPAVAFAPTSPPQLREDAAPDPRPDVAVVPSHQEETGAREMVGKAEPHEARTTAKPVTTDALDDTLVVDGRVAAGVLVIIIGAIVALGGLGAGFFAKPVYSAVQQVVSALWVLSGLAGLIIAAIGIAIVALRPPR